MEKEFTASYTNCAHNFSIYGFPDPTLSNTDTEIGFACVLFNLLHRGERKTLPSEYLKAKLGKVELGECYYLANDTEDSAVPNWNYTIKGSDDGYNPARFFFENLWEKYLPQYAWLRQFVIAEAKVEFLLPNNSGNWTDQAVDFFFAPAKLVIEIDGSQHKERLQQIKDRQRDAALEASGIHVHRFTTQELNEQGSAFLNKIEKLKQEFEKFISGRIITEAQEDSGTILFYEQVMRFQILILCMIRENCLSTTLKEWFFDVPEEQQQLFAIAAEDLFQWFENLYALVKMPFTRPEIVFKDDNAIKIQNKLFERIDDSNKYAEGIRIYTDYYDDFDHFKVESSGTLIHYDVDWPISDIQEAALLFILKNLFQYNSFRPGQLNIIAHALTLKDTIGILPTGSGKSLCYFLCCLLQPASSFAVCPIISLLKDQEKNLREFGVTRVAQISSMKTSGEKEQIVNNFGDRRYLMIWISPERFQSEKFREQLGNTECKLAYAVIDEVHCLSEWGHDFRTSYLTLIKTIRKYAPQLVLFGLTATASQAVLFDLKNEFEIDNSGVKATHSMGRNELNLEVKTVWRNVARNKLLAEIISDTELAAKDRKGIIFTQTKKKRSSRLGCIDLRDTIHKLRPDLMVKTFHGDLSSVEKDSVQDDFMSDKIDIMTATKAFGMGINKDDIRYTIHYGMPMSIESFYQEAGRAGRDGNSAKCMILYVPDEQSEKRDRLFEREVSSTKLKEAAESMRGDLSTLFFLWQLNNKGIEEDVEEVRFFLKQWFNLYQRSENFNYYCTPIVDIDKSVKHDLSSTQRALYHLKLLGIVYDWTIESYELGGRPCVIHVYTNPDNLNKEPVHKHFLAYIKKYDPLFEAEAENSRNKKYFDIIDTHDGKLLGYAKALITWMYEHIAYTRRVAIRNLLELCDDYTDSETFQNKIEDYLKIDEKSSLLDEIAAHPDDFLLWFEAFRDRVFNDGAKPVEKPLTEQGFASLTMSVSRYLESYTDNAGLDTIYLVSKAVSASIDNSIDIERLERLINGIVNSTVYAEKSDDILEKLIEVLAPYKHKLSIPLFCSAICKLKPEYAEKLYTIFEDDYSLSTYLANVSAQINTYVRSVYT